MTNVSCFFSEFLATAVLLVLVFAMTDKKNMAPPQGLAPLFLFFLILGIGAALGMETGWLNFPLNAFLYMELICVLIGYAINPARDLGPRLLTSMVGYGKAVYTFRK
jgi:aquaglyceroporin related protein